MEINGYVQWVKEPNTISRGIVLSKTVHVNVKNKDKNRLVRVYLPSTYDFSNPDKRFPVIYMLDGKNLFDDHTSFVGEWGVDETIEEAIDKKLTEGIIVVGIDSAKTAKDRALEMTPSGLIPDLKSKFYVQNGYAEILGDFIFNELKKEIDETFHTLPDKNHTGVGGSSMGGLMAFFLGVTYKEYVGYSLPFSPAFFLFTKESWGDRLKKDIQNKEGFPKFYFYVGGEGFEASFVKPTMETFKYMKKVGFNDDEIFYLQDKKKEHNEKAWMEYFPKALEFFNYLK